ncbi:MAG: class I adenylate-forming enzyme family protein [Ottowia sp.]|uniref:class I adenylate-forming enzyme family protein n=1 Tax=Ottowia sp. TaxID=1898956 RepID=UPI003C77A076
MDASFASISDLVRQHARQNPTHKALVDGSDPSSSLDYGALDERMDRIAAALQASGLRAGDSIAMCAPASVDYAAVFLGALRAGVVVAPLAPGSTPEALARMLADAQARLFFVDEDTAARMPVPSTGTPTPIPARIRLDGSPGGLSLDAWLARDGTKAPQLADLQPGSPFNIIYSSGTTGVPKGIVQSHGMRWAHIQRGRPYGYSAHGVTVLATPLYSNTTLVCFFPTLAFGGCVVLMPKFSADGYLTLCEQYGATHTMLVPVQYQRLMASEAFDRHDLSRFVSKFCTSAPFSAALKAEVLRRWPGGLIEIYGMTEGGGTCLLEAHLHPGKLHTVGRPAKGSDIRLIDEEGHEVPTGEVGEVVGHSAGMMIGYHGQPEKTREVEWFNPEGKRYIRTGDIGRFDADGFLSLLDRKKDVVISGGFNIYPSDLEGVLQQHPAVLEAAVVGVPSAQWGESPMAFAVLRPGAALSEDQLLAWTNERLGKTQRLVALQLVPELPRSPIGKVLKRDLRDASSQASGSS